MFEECLEHLKVATADASIKSVITVFPVRETSQTFGPRFWNSQLIRYACYKNQDGSLTGDPANLDLTYAIMGLGWTPPEPVGEFDILPVVIEVPGEEPRLFEMPPESCREVELEHPTLPQFKKLGLKWAAVPTICGFGITVGGVDYNCACFNGWFMNTEIARDLMDHTRYNKGEEIAKCIGLDTKNELMLWRDRAFLELNVAIVHSFRKSGVSIVDHITASKQFLTHDLREKKAGRECPAQWSWVVPPISGSLCPVFHHEMRDFHLEHAQYLYQAEVWDVREGEYKISKRRRSERRSMITSQEPAQGKGKLAILFASETGTAESYALLTAKKLRPYTSTVHVLNDVDPASLMDLDVACVLLITSTFGDGEAPTNGRQFLEKLGKLPAGTLEKVSYSVMAIGSSVYPEFCQAGYTLEKLMRGAGATEFVPLEEGDEIDGQADAVAKWINNVACALGIGGAKVPDTSVGMEVVWLKEDDPKVLSAQAAGPSKSLPAGYSLCPVTKNDELLQLGAGAVTPPKKGFHPFGSKSPKSPKSPKGGSSPKAEGTSPPPPPGGSAAPASPRAADGKRSTRFIECEIGTSGIRYETGDHVAVLAGNPDSEVQRILKHINAEQGAWFTVKGDTSPPFLLPAKVDHVLKYEMDLTTAETSIQEQLQMVATKVTDEKEKAELDMWVKELNDNDKDLQLTILSSLVTLADILDRFKSAKLTLADIIAVTPKIKPRFYSIASAKEMHPGAIQLTVGVLLATKMGGAKRPGLCSVHLASLQPYADAIRLSVRTSKFRMPATHEMPVIMVGPGTGISPMLGFLQAREVAKQKGEKLGPCMVFFGCRDKEDFLHQKQLEAWESSKVITHLMVAQSRVSPEKVYVQTLMAKNRPKAWALLQQPKCHYYVCGDSQMASDVFEELRRITYVEGKLSYIEAKRFFESMKDEGRFQADTWGLVTHRAQTIQRLTMARQTKAQDWLNNVNTSQALGGKAAAVEAQAPAKAPKAQACRVS